MWFFGRLCIYCYLIAIEFSTFFCITQNFCDFFFKIGCLATARRGSSLVAMPQDLQKTRHIYDISRDYVCCGTHEENFARSFRSETEPRLPVRLCANEKFARDSVLNWDTMNDNINHSQPGALVASVVCLISLLDRLYVRCFVHRVAFILRFYFLCFMYDFIINIYCIGFRYTLRVLKHMPLDLCS